MKSAIPILLYHDIESCGCPNEKTGDATKDTVVRMNDFTAQIKYLAENGFKTLTLNQWSAACKNRWPIEPKSIVITFDDGHISNYRLAFPVLRQYGFTATFFVIAGRVDTAYHLTGAQIREMVDHGMEIGSHGITHAYLPLLDLSAAQKEIVESKAILEQFSDQKINFFCFPGGHYNRGLINLVRQAAYKGACSCIAGINTITTNPYLLKRIEVRKKGTLDDFQGILTGRYHNTYFLIDRIKGILKKSIGLNTYSRMRSRFYKYYIFKR